MPVPLHDDQQRLLDMLGWELDKVDWAHTAWNTGSSFSTGVFADFECLPPADVGSPEYKGWSKIERHMKWAHDELTPYWGHYAEIAVAVSSDIVKSHNREPSVPDAFSTRPLAMHSTPDPAMQSLVTRTRILDEVPNSQEVLFPRRHTVVLVPGTPSLPFTTGATTGSALDGTQDVVPDSPVEMLGVPEFQQQSPTNSPTPHSHSTCTCCQIAPSPSKRSR